MFEKHTNMSAENHANQVVGNSNQIVNFVVNNHIHNSTNPHVHNTAMANEYAKEQLKLIMRENHAVAMQEIEDLLKEFFDKFVAYIHEDKIDATAFRRKNFVLDTKCFMEAFMFKKSSAEGDLLLEIIRSSSCTAESRASFIMKQAVSAIRGLGESELETLSFIYLFKYLTFNCYTKDHLEASFKEHLEIFDRRKISKAGLGNLVGDGILSQTLLGASNFKDVSRNKYKFIELPAASDDEIRKLICNHWDFAADRNLYYTINSVSSANRHCFYGINESSLRNYYESIETPSPLIQEIVNWCEEQNINHKNRPISFFESDVFKSIDGIFQSIDIQGILNMSHVGGCIAYHHLITKRVKLPPFGEFIKTGSG